MKPKFVLVHDFFSVHHDYFVGTFASILLSRLPPVSNVWLRTLGKINLLYTVSGINS